MVIPTPCPSLAVLSTLKWSLQGTHIIEGQKGDGLLATNENISTAIFLSVPSSVNPALRMMAMKKSQYLLVSGAPQSRFIVPVYFPQLPHQQSGRESSL